MNAPKAISDLHSLEYEHSFDETALDALESTPGLDTLIRQFMKHGAERFFSIQLAGSYLKVTSGSHPELMTIFHQACEILSLQKIPDLYIEPSDKITATTIGVDHPIVLLPSKAVDELSDSELMFILGREIGHIKSSHTLYHLMAEVLSAFGDTFGKMALGLGNLLATPLELALVRWSQMSELTSDRAGLLACQDMNTALSVMIKLAGLPGKFPVENEIQHFIQQARDFEDLDYDNINKWMKIFVHLYSSNSWSVMRASELLQWVDAGEYKRVLSRESKEKIRKKTDNGSIYCRNCNYRLKGPEKFCPSCGFNLTA